jgi:hypothetical protein
MDDGRHGAPHRPRTNGSAQRPEALHIASASRRAGVESGILKAHSSAGIQNLPSCFADEGQAGQGRAGASRGEQGRAGVSGMREQGGRPGASRMLQQDREQGRRPGASRAISRREQGAGRREQGAGGVHCLREQTRADASRREPGCASRARAGGCRRERGLSKRKSSSMDIPPLNCRPPGAMRAAGGGRRAGRQIAGELAVTSTQPPAWISRFS